MVSELNKGSGTKRKPGQKRKPNQRLAHRRLIARWLFEGEMTAEEMAQELGVSVQQVNYDVAKIKEQWRRETVQDMEARKDRMLAELMLLRRQYQKGWSKSLKDKTRKTTGLGKFGPLDMLEVEEQGGDAKFLDGYLKTLGEEARLFGLYEHVNTDALLGEVILEALRRAGTEEMVDALPLDDVEPLEDSGVEEDTSEEMGKKTPKTLNRAKNQDNEGA
ncbi:MAG: hypothetical protein U0641_05725 [Anaerolineae bacterium]